MSRLTRPRIVEIGIALLLTLAALMFVGLTVWAAERGILVADPWARPTIGQSTVTAAYLSIVNSGEEGDVLRSAHSSKAKAVEMHETTMTPDGVMQMRKAEAGLVIPAGGTLALAPGGAHLMLVGLQEKLQAGDNLSLTLEFERAGAVEVQVPIMASEPAH